MTEETRFHEARSRVPSERAAFLDANCANPEMRNRVEGLLQAHAAAAVLDQPAMTGAYTPQPVADAAVEQAGMIIGSYKLLQKLGEGGMGALPGCCH